jgi:hypothetical protein
LLVNAVIIQDADCNDTLLYTYVLDCTIIDLAYKVLCGCAFVNTWKST